VRTPRQLTLALGHGESFAREDLVAGAANAAALRLIDQWPDWPARTVVLVGPQGAGKSHLAAIWATASGARVAAAHGLDEAGVPGALATGALVVEDVVPGEFDERAFFHLINLARSERADVLLTSREPPATWAARIPDLASRFREIPVVRLDPPGDELLQAVLVKLFADRQLAVDDSLIGYLLARMERSYAAAGEMVAALDREALQRHRPVTRALASELFRDPAT
jgi:chromosomal replication initiation ATPase DnaA